MMKKYFFLTVAIASFLLSFISLSAKQNKTVVEVYYFHATIRCQGCLAIEENIENAMSALYSKELKSGKFKYYSIDFLKPENEHYQDDYKFDVQTLIISKKVNGKEVKWKNLEKIWDYSGDYGKFEKYIKEEINKL